MSLSNPVNPGPALTSTSNSPITLYSLSTAEFNLSVVPANLSYPVGDIRRYGATGTGTTDDSLAIKTAIQVVNASYALPIPVPVVMYAAAGFYLITSSQGTMPAFAPGVPGYVKGDGIHKTYFQLDPSYSGDLFAWSESWMMATYNAPFQAAADKAGPKAIGFTVLGNTASPNQQNVMRFYDRNDHVVIEDVDAYFIPGQFFSCGRTLNQTQAYMRESQIRNIKCFYAGTATQPAVEISSTTTAISDATNDVTFSELNVFSSAGRGVVISNPNNFSSTRALRFYNLRSENNAGDAVTLGLATDSGSVSSINIYTLDVPGIRSGTYGIVVNNNGTTLPYGIMISGATITGGAGSNGINIGAANGVSIQVANMSVSGTPINIAGNNAALYSISWAGQAVQTASAAVTSAAHSTLPMLSPAYFAGPPGAINQAGFAALKGTGSSTGAIRLTADGNAANGSNIFNPPFSCGYHLGIRLIAQDTTISGNAYVWRCTAYFSAFSGAGTATVILGTPETVINGSAGSASVSCTSDTVNGGINLSFTPPTGNTDTWRCAALISWSRGP